MVVIGVLRTCSSYFLPVIQRALLPLGLVVTQGMSSSWLMGAGPAGFCRNKRRFEGWFRSFALSQRSESVAVVTLFSLIREGYDVRTMHCVVGCCSSMVQLRCCGKRNKELGDGSSRV